MKRIGNVYHKIYEKDNIRQAILSASQGKRHKRGVMKVFENLDKAIDLVHDILKNKTYIPNPYWESVLIDGASKKERIIYKPKFFPDQVIHWCLMNIIKPQVVRGMYKWNCASIPNRGTLYAKKATEKWIRTDHTNTRYALKIDIKKYYPNINKETLKMKFRRIIKDPDVLWLLDIIIDSHHLGIPIGNYTSQWFANFYLQDLDHYIKETLGAIYYVRYMDDMVVFGSNKKKLRKDRLLIEAFLNNESLTIKENWQVFNIDKRPLDFVGYVFKRDKTYVRKRITARMRKRYLRFEKQPTKHLACSMMSYLGWLMHSDSYILYKKYFKNIKLMKEFIRHGN